MDATSDGLTIRYDDSGASDGGPALLCLPGWCAGRGAFDNLARAFAGKRRVLALDWRGHGASDAAGGDFGAEALVRDARAVLDAAGVTRAVPVATAHAGWVAIELRRQLGPEAIPKLVLVDWIVGAPPPPFLGALGGLQAEATWLGVRDRLFDMWLHGVDDAEVRRFVREDMGSYGFDMWARGGREISAAYARAGTPLDALGRLAPPAPTLHVYAQPLDETAQQAFAAAHPWFTAARVRGHSHFPTIESAAELQPLIDRFLAA